MAQSSKDLKAGDALDRWVGIGEAGRLLGVRPATVRRWTGQGRLTAFVTPGGHRRYRVGDLLEFTDHSLQEEESGPPGLAKLTEPDRREAVSEARKQPWFGLLHASDRDRYRERGRETLRLIESYLREGSGSDDLIRSLESQGAEYGAQAAALGMSLKELLTAFNLFRRPLIAHINEVGDTSSRHGLFERVTDMFDLCMAAMVESFLEATLRPITNRPPEHAPDGAAAN